MYLQQQNKFNYRKWENKVYNSKSFLCVTFD